MSNNNQIDDKHPIEKASRLAGGRAALARILGVTVSAIGNYKTRGVPAEKCPEIERHTGVLCEELRPDVRWDVIRGTAIAQGATAAATQPTQPTQVQQAAQPVAQGV